MLVDTGPLVALVVRSEPRHDECVRTLATFRGRLVTVWPVIVEAMHLVGGYRGAHEAIWKVLEAGAVELATLDAADIPRMRTLMAKHVDLPMDLADAALVRVAERQKIRKVFTLDRREFRLYRPLGIGRFTVVP